MSQKEEAKIGTQKRGEEKRGENIKEKKKTIISLISRNKLF
jgi:ribosome maturation protein Sdo1